MKLGRICKVIYTVQSHFWIARRQLDLLTLAHFSGLFGLTVESKS